MKKYFFYISLIFSNALVAQTIISWTNPSYEGIPQCCKLAKGWSNCGFADESPPDIMPGAFFQNSPPYHGKTYLGMVVRDNNTFEAVGQKLEMSLKKGKKYKFTAALLCADTILSQSPVSKKSTNFNLPVYLKLWGGNDSCDRKHLLFTTSNAISNRKWETIDIIFNVYEDVNTLIFQADFAPEGIKVLPFCGNIQLGVT